LKECGSSESIAKRNFIVRLLSHRDWSQVCAHQDGLLVKGAHKEFVLAIQEMLQPAEMLSGILGARLIIKTNRTIHSVAGFKKTELSPLIENLNSKLKLHAENLLRSESLELHSVAKSIQQFLDRKQYARDSKRRQLLGLAIRANSIQQRSFWSVYANQEQLDSAAYSGPIRPPVPMQTGH
jgi:DNA helicase IV / RNA helicase N terminal